MLNKLLNFFNNDNKLYIRSEEDKAKSRENALDIYLHIKEIKRQWKEQECERINHLEHYSFIINDQEHVYGIVSISEFLDLDLSSTNELYKLLCLDDNDVIQIKEEECWGLSENFKFTTGFGHNSVGEGWFKIYKKSLEGSSLHMAVFNAMELGRKEWYEELINTKEFKLLKKQNEINKKFNKF